MPSLVPGFEYDIFISYRQKDNKHDGWVTEFVNALKSQIEAAFKEDISIYFDVNPHDGLHANHEVDDSLREKLKCLILIPIISQTYCDPKSFAWQHELLAFVKMASEDKFGMKTKLAGGNVASRVLSVKIHDIAAADKQLFEQATGSVMRSIDFIYKETGVNRPLRPTDERNQNLERSDYRNQVNKVANAVKDILNSLTSRTGDPVSVGAQTDDHNSARAIEIPSKPKLPVPTFADQLGKLVALGRTYWRPLGLVLLIAAVGWGGYWTGSQRGDSFKSKPVLRYELPLESALGRTGRHGFKISRDGKQIVYVMNEQLMLKALDSDGPAVVIPGTQGARHPFFSPDGNWVGFADHANSRLMKIRLQGGSPIKICDMDNSDYGMNWYDTEVLFSTGRTLYRVPDSGGVPTVVYSMTDSGANNKMWNPQYLPGNDYVLFNQTGMLERGSHIMSWKVGSQEKPAVLLNGSDGHYLNSGHLAYVMDDGLYVSRLEIASSLTVSAPSLIETKSIMLTMGQNDGRAVAQVDFSDNGILAYYQARSRERHIVWIDRSGVRTRITAEAGEYSAPALSPDGRQIAITGFNNASDQTQIELASPTLGTAVQFAKPGVFPVWSHDNSSIYYGIGSKVFKKPLDLSYEPRLVLEWKAIDDIVLGNLSADGRFLLMSAGGDIAYFDRRDSTLHMLDFIDSRYEMFPSISPDGKWLAYGSNFSGVSEVYVVPFPGPGQRQKISAGEAYSPLWSPDMKSIYFIYQGGAQGALMEVKVNTQGGFSSGKPAFLFNGDFANHYGYFVFGKYDIHPRGDRFLGVQSVSDTTSSAINVVVNWQQGLNKK